MLNIFAVTLPFFALVLAGFVAGRRGWLPLEAIGGLNAFVLYFALPCMLFRFGAGMPLSQWLNWSLVVLYLPCGLWIVAMSVIHARAAGLRWDDAAFGALVAAFSNTGFMGVPLLVALLGTVAAGPTILSIALDMILTTSLCVALSRLDAPGGASQALLRSLKGMLSNPMPWAIGAGAFVSGMGWRLDAPVLAPIMKTVQLLGDAASPVALFTIGAVLARSVLKNQAAPPGADSERLSTYLGETQLQSKPMHRLVWSVALTKLFIHPLLVFAMGWALGSLGLEFDNKAWYTLILVAALPSASNVVILAERFQADSGRIAQIVLVTTCIAFVSFSLCVRLLGMA